MEKDSGGEAEVRKVQDKLNNRPSLDFAKSS
jgi:hypothetical protein